VEFSKGWALSFTSGNFAQQGAEIWFGEATRSAIRLMNDCGFMMFHWRVASAGIAADGNCDKSIALRRVCVETGWEPVRCRLV
jgi:hypothetical protein